MKRFPIPLVAIFALIVIVPTHAAPPIYPGVVPYEQLDTRNFELSDYPILRMMPFMPRGAPPYLAVDTWSFAINTNTWYLYGFNPLNSTWNQVAGDSLWTNELNVLHPRAPAPFVVHVTNLLSSVATMVDGELQFVGWQSVNLVAGTNQVDATGRSILYVTGTGTNCVLQLNAQNPGKDLYIINATNSTFTMHNMGAWDFPAWIQVLRGGLWIPSESGETLQMLGFTNEVVEVMRVNPRGGASGSVLNPTVDYVPYNSGGTNFGDSHFYRLASGMGTDTNFYFGPGQTNVLIRTGKDLIYTNSNNDVQFGVVNGLGNAVTVESQGYAGVFSGDGGVVLRQTANQVELLGGVFAPVTDVTEALGSMATAWSNVISTNVWLRGFSDPTTSETLRTNYSRLAIYYPSTNDPAIFDIQTSGTGTNGANQGFSFRTNGVEVFNFSGTGGTFTNLTVVSNVNIHVKGALRALFDMTNTVWVTKDGDDTVAGRGRMDRTCETITNAVALAQPGDTIVVGPGTFDLGTDSVSVGGISIIGYGPGVSIITGTGANMFKLTNSIHMANLSIWSTNETGASCFPIDAEPFMDASLGNPVTITLDNLNIDGVSDGMRLYGTNKVTATINNCRVTTHYDGVIFYTTEATSSCDIHGCDVVVTKHASLFGTEMRGILLNGGTNSVTGCSIKVSDATDRTKGIYSYAGNNSIAGTTIYTTSASGTVYDVHEVAGNLNLTDGMVTYPKVFIEGGTLNDQTVSANSTRLHLMGVNATPTRATNEFVFGDANYLYTFPGTSGLDGYTFQQDHPSVSLPWKTNKTTVVIEGDSLSLTTTYRWPDWFTNQIGWNGFSTYSNVATTGATLSDITNDWATQIAPLSPGSGTNGLLLLWVGANDYHQAPTVPADWLNTWSNYVLTAKASNFTVCAFTIMPHNAGETVHARTNLYLMNQGIRNSGLWDYLVDANAMFPNYSNTVDFVDGTHLTTNGFYRLAANIDGVLRGPRRNSPRDNYIRSGTNYVFVTPDGVEQVRMNSDGYALEVDNNIGLSSTGNILWGNNVTPGAIDRCGILAWDTGLVKIGSYSASDLVFSTGPSLTERMRFVHSTLKFGIGTNAPDEKLQVVGNVSVTGTNFVNQLVVTNGGSFGAPVITSSSSTNGPAQNEFVTARWARETFGGSGAFFYNSTNLSGTAFDANTYQYIGSVPTNGSRSYTPAAGDYIGSVITTNRYQQVNGPVMVSAYLTSTGGAANSAYGIHPEIYYTYDTNSATLLGDYSAAAQTIIHGAVTNRYDWVISFPPIISTNSSGFWVVRRFKVDTKVGTDTLTLSVGTNAVVALDTPSSISFTQPAAAGANWVAEGTQNSRLPGNASITGTNFVNELVVTNAATIATSIHAGGGLLQTPELYYGASRVYRTALTPVDAGTAMDFALTNRSWTLSLTGAVSLTTANLLAGKCGNILITNAQATNCAFTFPAWIFIGYKPTYITAGKCARIDLESTAAADAAVYAYYGEQQ